MQFRILPGTELDVSEVCLGTMTWGEQNSEAEAHAQLDYAVAQGINFIDTAEMYPVPPNGDDAGAHRDVSRQLACAPAARRTGHRHQGRRAGTPRLDPQGPHGPDARGHRRGGRHEPRAIADRLSSTSIRSIGRSATCRCSARPSSIPPKEKDGPSIREQVEGMAAMIKAGKIRYYGLSNETAWGVCEFRRVARELGVPVRSRSRTATAWSRAAWTTIWPKCCSARRCRCSRTARSRAACSPASISAARSRRTRAITLFDGLGMRFRKPMVHEAIEAYAALAKERGLTLVQLALGYVKSRWHVGASIIGATSMAATRGGHRGGAVRARCRNAGRDRGDPDTLSESRGLATEPMITPDLLKDVPLFAEVPAGRARHDRRARGRYPPARRRVADSGRRGSPPSSSCCRAASRSSSPRRHRARHQRVHAGHVLRRGAVAARRRRRSRACARPRLRASSGSTSATSAS